ncbi:zinc-dependent peptidase [Pseudoxanthomonas winnipegensis]|uniref:M90 family metallopeptidase n=1 Tax=Pseudoxanthomonas winnipegensis TaxID=2480810 RepID=UPI00197DF500|nr:M90 family metallopeptidase [Pseudoxanthomonas winnipegensis]
MEQLPARDVPLIQPLLRWLRGQPPSLDDALWQQASAGLPWVCGLQPSQRETLRALAARFLHQKTITALGDLELDEHARVQLAALCCLPLLEFGIGGLRGWSQLIVYPEAFRVQRSHVDAAGVLHEWEDELAGESWDSGPLILSWADVQADIEDPAAGYCVAVHEMAHKLDGLNGVLDGSPPLPGGWQRAWAKDFQQHYDALCLRVDAGKRTRIDGYAAESPEEFFAVVSEYHFSAPQVLREAMPEVAEHLVRLYGAPPAMF